MGAQVAKHNDKLLSSAKTRETRTPHFATTRRARLVIVPFQMIVQGMAPCTRLLVRNNKEEEDCYAGLAKKIKIEHKPKGYTTLSTHFWKDMEAGEGGGGKTWIEDTGIKYPNIQPSYKNVQLMFKRKI